MRLTKNPNAGGLMHAKTNLIPRIQTAAIFLVSVAGILTATLANPISAHEGRDVGGYNFVVGFLHEPAYEGQLNAVSLIVTRVAGEEHATDDASTADAGMNSQPDTNEDDGHDHSHDEEENQPSLNTTDDEIDVLTHGALFISPGLKHNEAFDFEISDELKGLGLPYHIHPGDYQGLIIVAEEDAHKPVERTVSLTIDGINPKRIETNVGDTLVWTNDDFQNTVVMSGPLSSMTPEIKSMVEAGTSGAVAQTATPIDRVTGLAATLEVELTHLSTSISKSMQLTELVDDPGHYIAEFVPTSPGDYQVRFFGSIEGNAIDETFDSGPDTFDTIIPSDAIQFPVVLESNREIQNATRGALDAVQELESEVDTASSAASTGMIIGIVGILFGLIAIGTSFFAITIARRRN